jgi:hypothetical protein
VVDGQLDRPGVELFEVHHLVCSVISSYPRIALTQTADSLEGFLVFQLVVVVRSGPRELPQLGQDLRRRRIWLSLSVRRSANVIAWGHRRLAYLNVPLRSLEKRNSSVHILICDSGILL